MSPAGAPPSDGAVTALSLRDVGIRYDGAESWTPDRVTLTIEPGEVVLLLGPSGSGKSTLTLALNGLIPHAVPAELRGTVAVCGHETTATSVARLSEQVAMVFQDPDTQIVTGTVLDEVCFGPENLLVDPETILRRAESALRAVRLWARRMDSPDRLSGGERQRLAIACAIALESPIIVLDEPTANLDPSGIEDVYATLSTLVATRTRSVLLVEHNLDAAVGFLDRVIALDSDGTVVADGSVDDVLRGQADLLHHLGVWLPVSTLAAMRLRDAGVPLPRLALTPAELAEDLDQIVDLATPRPVAAATQVRESHAIRVRDLTVRKGRTEILHGIDLDVPEGAMVAVLGGNGAGKTTLLQAIAGVVPPPRGSVLVSGIDTSTASVRELAATVGFVFQNPEHQFITHTVADELAHSLRVQRRDESEITDRVDAMLARFGLADRRNQHPFTLSGGQKRRLSVGTALIGGARVLALDEPTFGQDRQRASELLDLLAQLNDDGTTIVLVTHDMQLAANYASHLAILADGQLSVFDEANTVLASAALQEGGLRIPPLRQAMLALENHPTWKGITRMSELPGGAR